MQDDAIHVRKTSGTKVKSQNQKDMKEMIKSEQEVRTETDGRCIQSYLMFHKALSLSVLCPLSSVLSPLSSAESGRAQFVRSQRSEASHQRNPKCSREGEKSSGQDGETERKTKKKRSRTTQELSPATRGKQREGRRREEDSWGREGRREGWTNPGAPPGFCSSSMKNHLILKLNVDFVRLYGGPEGQIQQIQAALCSLVCVCV